MREVEILRIAISIEGREASRSAEKARHEILRWAQNRCGGTLPEEAWRYEDFEYLVGGRNSIGVRIETDASDIWALRAEDPDKMIAGRVWTTEVAIGVTSNRAPQLSVRLLVSTAEDELDIQPHAPGFIQQVSEKCGLICGKYELTSSPRVIESHGDTETLIEMLTDPQRRLPVFLLTVQDSPAGYYKPLIDADALAKATLGLGHVVVLPAPYTRLLTNRFGRTLSVFNGGVRAYLPGFTAHANPYMHRLVIGEHLQSTDGVRQCNRWMQSLAASESIRHSTMGVDVLAFSTIKNARLTIKQESLETDGASDSDQLAAAKARISALEDQIQQQHTELEYFDSEHSRAEERAEAAEEQVRASAFRIQQLIDQLKSSSGTLVAEPELPDTWESFVNWCDVHLAGRVVLSPNARRALRSPQFDDVNVAARCLLWLATECRERHIVGGDGSLREESVGDGIRNAHCGNDQFDLDWQGQRFTADWHIKNGGNTRNPKRCLRIYYFWEPTSQQIVIAEMPAHRRTGAT